MVNREELIAYLLHEMREPERLDFAARWFVEPELNEELCIAEAELFDSYVRGELPRHQRTQVERYLLNTEDQRRKLEFAAALRGAFPLRQRRWISWWALAAAAVIAILAGATLWMAVRNRELGREVARLQQNAQPEGAGIYSASMVAGGLRGGAGERSIVVPRDARILRLDLDLSEVEKRGPYAATLSTSGRRIWREEPVAPQAQASLVTVWIPADILPSGHYTLILEAGSAAAAYYNLAITR